MWVGPFSFRSETMIVKISDIADAQGGLVLSRKEARNPTADSHQYRRLTLRALGDNGYINPTELEDFYAAESLDNALFTTSGSIAVRLAFPLYPVLINEECQNLLVPSQIAVLKVKDCKVVLPAYLRLCLAQRDVQDRVQKIESGTAQRTVKIGTIMDLQIAVPNMETQRKAVAIDELSRKRERMYRDLIEQERLFNDAVIENIIGGTI